MIDINEIYRAIGGISEKVNNLNSKLDRLMQLYNNQRMADIDYIAMETNIDLDQSDEQEEE